ncbi:MAG: tRNA uridine-5-carboxymethylaminomethyl(34) synthesis GTPase MnmE [Mariprofundaceae bacterium]
MDTIAAIATPLGRGGVGIIRISGAEAHDLARCLSGVSTPLTPRCAQLASFSAADGRVLDSGLLLYFQAPHSYTGEDVVELQAHGSPVLLQALLARVLDLGARQAEAGEFTRRAVQNGKMHLEQAEAVAACIDAATLRAAKQAQRHLQGEFGEQLSALMDVLTGLVAHVEACLDFPEEDVPPLLFEQLRGRLDADLLQPMDAALNTANFGERLFQGASVAIIGAPNVGKSTLLNRLSGRERAIVSPLPGTTRDVLEVDFEAHGIPVRLLDTAGMRESDDVIEQEGVRRAHAAAQTADLTVFIADAGDASTWQISDADIYVLNKCDLVQAQPADGAAQDVARSMRISAETGSGIDALLARMAELLGEIPAAEENLLVTSRRHQQLLMRSRAHLLRGRDLLGAAVVLDIVALEWRQAWSCLGEILGIGDVDHILDRVFSEFCIGK